MAVVALLAAALMLPVMASADVRSGVAAWEAGNYAAAVREWRPLAVAGDADAQFNLGQAYKLGRGVEQDLAQAAEWFRRAAAQGHLQGEDNLGLVLYELGRKDEALPWLERSASRGEPRAQYVLAAELFNGERISRDWPRAYALMKRASDAGLQRAAAALVQMDQAIPLEQRQEGLALAAAMERSEAQARVAAMTAGTPARPNVPASVRPADIPVSQPGVTYVPPPVGADPATMPAAVAPPVPAPVVAPVAAAPRPATGNWRVQLGAFSNRDNAQAMWGRVSARLGNAQPTYVAAGNVVRLQAGPYASRAAAEAACAGVRPNACFAVSR